MKTVLASIGVFLAMSVGPAWADPPTQSASPLALALPSEPGDVAVDRLSTYYLVPDAPPLGGVSIQARAGETLLSEATRHADPSSGLNLELGEHTKFRSEASVSAPLGGGVDVGVSVRATIDESAFGKRTIKQSVVKVRQRLKGLLPQRRQSPFDAPAVYLFAAKGGDALTWTPSTARQGGLRYQGDRMEVGEVQAGIGFEAMTIQGSVSYLQREDAGEKNDYFGVTLTMRR